MRLAVLDIGSNSAQLQVADLAPGAPPLPLQAVKEPTLLAQELGADGAVSAAGMEQVAAAAGRGVLAADRLGAELLYPFVTAAVRDATNRDQVLDRIEEVSGVRPQYLSGSDEGRLTYFAARRWYGWSAGQLLVVDIGGGSMEVVLGRDVDPAMAVSLPLGAGKLTRDLAPADRPTARQLKAIRRHTRDGLAKVVDRMRWEGEPRRAVATSKTFKQLARLAGAAPQRHGPFTSRTLRRSDLRELVPRLAKLSVVERGKLRGVSKSRSRQIVTGAVVAEAAMTALGLDSVEVCPWALREGIMLCHLENIAARAAMPLRPLTLPAAPETVLELAATS
ncbi:hypothetical protein [Amycolatopsis benzoatilytica]|uniref:Ppx/GppA phosphatase family protein n=1 Tax=Amycolatopsis benzoatilytica TaxID=346045 RepID=UPI00048366C4|nr:hypothetical protein [Amycolatopsis benzoatilytica]